MWGDQVIYLPLPFMDGIILAAYRQEPQQAITFLEYLTTSTNQQKRAARVMERVALEEAGRRRNSHDIAFMAESLQWLPQPYPKEFGSYLPQMLEIAQGVRASLEASSAHRRMELLQSPIAQLGRLKNTLTLEKKARRATAWGGVANHWQGILETAHRSLAEEAKKSGEIPNPYVAGQPLNPEESQSRFKGRRDLFRRMEELALASQAPILLLLGGRRTGKSSSLNFLPEKMGPEWIPLVVDGQGLSLSTSIPGVVEGLIKAILESARRNRNLQLPTPDREQVQKDPFPAFLHWMEQAEKSVAPEKKFLLCLDEFERLGQVVERNHGDPGLLNFLRHVAQKRRHWVVLFSGVHPLEDLPPYWSDCLINSQTIHISFLQTDEARELIQQPIDQFPDIYTQEAVEALLHITRCHPYLVQLLCSLLVERLNATRQTRVTAAQVTADQVTAAQVTAADVAAVAPLAFDRGMGYFDEWWRTTLHDDERKILETIHRQEPVGDGKNPALRRLLRLEVIEKKDGQYKFQVPLLEQYVALQLGE
ncbi:MAG: hypothetical protein HQL65_11870 [Magnetococcales bacterium]|nr:hypothetical protein [Magnetococcales bacterium]